MANPVPSYSSDPAERTFRSCVPLLKQSWVHSFLMSPPEVYNKQLQQSLLQPRRVTAEMIITTTTPADSLSLNECIRFLLLPSFSTGPVTVGYQVTEYVTTALSVVGMPYVSRCVRDDDNGGFLTIADLPDGITEVTFCVQHSPGFREHVFMILHTATFNNLLNALGEGKGYDEATMKDALIYSFQSCELRECPSCGARSVTCTCPRALVRKQHAMDFEGDIANLTTYMGDYEGMSYQAVYQQGVTLYNGMYSTRASVEFSWDMEGRRKLETWALQDSFRGRDINLVKMVMPSAATNPIPMYTDVPRNDGKRALTWRPFTDNVCADVAIDQFIADDRDIDNFPELGSICTPDETRRSHTATTITARTAMSGAGGDTGGTVSSVSHAGPHRLSPPHDMRIQQKPVSVTSPPPAMVVAAQPEMVANPISSNAVNAAPVRPIPLFDRDAITRPKRIGRPPAPKIRPVTRLVPIVPATEAVAAAGVQKAIDGFSEEARRKIELRKARNRASAIRSNEKKKKQMQELKDGLEQAKKEENALRAKERRLREANLALRTKIAK